MQLHKDAFSQLQVLHKIALEAVLLKLHMKLTPEWALIQVNFDPIWAKVGGGCSFVSGHTFTTVCTLHIEALFVYTHIRPLWYNCTYACFCQNTIQD